MLVFVCLRLLFFFLKKDTVFYETLQENKTNKIMYTIIV